MSIDILIDRSQCDPRMIVHAKWCWCRSSARFVVAWCACVFFLFCFVSKSLSNFCFCLSRSFVISISHLDFSDPVFPWIILFIYVCNMHMYLIYLLCRLFYIFIFFFFALSSLYYYFFALISVYLYRFKKKEKEKNHT